MTAGQVCGRCGVELAESTSSGYCPGCLLRDALPGPAPKPGPVGSDAAGAKPASPGQTFGNYQVLGKLGQGGMGVVYKARQLNLDRLVALKLLPFGQFSNEDVVQRFKIEATAAAGLQHPNIVAIHDVGEEAGQHYFSMDFVEGQTLAEVVREKPLPAKRAAGYLKTIAEAVHYAHQHGILHRDLKPSNILIDRSDQPRITDFGLAKRLSVDSDMTLTGTGQVLGSPNFMAPEQAEGRTHEIGPATEVYSLGALLYHLLTRQPPFQGETLTTLLKQVIETEPVPLRRLNPSVPRDLETICLKCLEKEPARRYPTAQALAEDMERFLQDKPIRARPVGLAGKGWKWCRRRPALAGMGGALVLIFLLGMAGIVSQWRHAKANELVARQNAYAADISGAQHALDEGDLGRAVSLLDDHRPVGKSIADLRHWEWRYLWALCQGDERFELHRYTDSIDAVAISSDGKLLAVQTGGDKLGLWDLATRRNLLELTAAASRALAFSPKEPLLAYASRDVRGEPTVQVWDTESRKLRDVLVRTNGVRSLAFSPDGQLLAMFDDDGSADVIEWRSHQSLTTMIRAARPRRAEAGVIAFSPDGQRLAAGGDYGKIWVVNRSTREVQEIQTQTSDGVTALAFSPDGRILAAGFGYNSGTIHVWDPISGEARGQLTNHTGFVRALAFSADGQRLASASSDQTVRIWNVADQAPLRCLVGHRDQVLAVAFAPDGGTVVSGCKDGSVYLWDLNAVGREPLHRSLRISSDFGGMAQVERAGFTPEKLDPKTVHRLGVAFTTDSQSFVATEADGSLVVHSTRTPQPAERLATLGTNVWGVAFSPGDRWLAAGDASGKIHVWDWKARQRVKSLVVPFEWCGTLRFSHLGNFLMVKLIFSETRPLAGGGRFTNRIRIWRTDDWEQVPLTQGQETGLYVVDLAPDERTLAAGYAGGSVKLWSFPGKHSEGVYRHAGAVFGIVFSPDGRVVVSTSADSTVKVWDVVAQRELARLKGHVGNVWTAAFSPDGRRLATTGGLPQAGQVKGAVKLWDMTTHRELLNLSAEGQLFLDIRFSPDGNILAATSLDGVANLWRTPSWEEIRAAEKGHPGK